MGTSPTRKGWPSGCTSPHPLQLPPRTLHQRSQPLPPNPPCRRQAIGAQEYIELGAHIAACVKTAGVSCGTLVDWLAGYAGDSASSIAKAGGSFVAAPTTGVSAWASENEANLKVVQSATNAAFAEELRSAARAAAAAAGCSDPPGCLNGTVAAAWAGANAAIDKLAAVVPGGVRAIVDIYDGSAKLIAAGKKLQSASASDMKQSLSAAVSKVAGSLKAIADLPDIIMAARGWKDLVAAIDALTVLKPALTAVDRLRDADKEVRAALAAADPAGNATNAAAEAVKAAVRDRALGVTAAVLKTGEATYNMLSNIDSWAFDVRGGLYTYNNWLEIFIGNIGMKFPCDMTTKPECATALGIKLCANVPSIKMCDSVSTRIPLPNTHVPYIALRLRKSA